MAASHGRPQVNHSQLWLEREATQLPKEVTSGSITDATLAFMIGFNRQQRLQARSSMARSMAQCAVRSGFNQSCCYGW
eukprot:Skav211363  [mRNA]  locus=scaffold677:439125:439358:- [translate_table: standard]